MKISDIQRIRIDIVSDELSALHMMLDRDGRISRQGYGNLPVEEFIVTSESDASVFQQLLEKLSENMFEHAGVYDHPDKNGVPIVMMVAFLDQADETEFFEFRFGTENEDLGELLPFFDQFISYALSLSNHWYQAELEKNTKTGA
ncbi:MAG: hypothetical protein OEX12_14570 [Gammaproteobacteria bacterium]|nr:hypothetical protein [Gammaproteobacteria bacterium]